MAVLQTNEIFKTELAEGQHRLSDEEIHQVQRVVYGITIDITNLCDKYDIPYMLTGQLNTHPRPAISYVKEDRKDYSKFANELYDIINS